MACACAAMVHTVYSEECYVDMLNVAAEYLTQATVCLGNVPQFLYQIVQSFIGTAVRLAHGPSTNEARSNSRYYPSARTWIRWPRAC